MAIEQNILVAADTVLLTKSRQVLLIKRLNLPFQNTWAFPGGFVEDDEDLEIAASRELLEETSIKIEPSALIQFGAFGKPGRDPRGRTLSVVYYSILPSIIDGKAADDAKDLAWFDLNALPEMAFDHREILDELLSSVTY
ncbi:MAG: NUDIX hydrolase [Flavobacteriales bacterium]